MRSPGAVVLLAVVASIRAMSAQAPGNRSDETAIRTVMEATTKAFSYHDAKAWARFCTPTARLVTVRGESMDGVAEIETGWRTSLRRAPEPLLFARWTSASASSDRTLLSPT